MEGNVNVEVSKELVEPILKSEIQAAIVKQLGGNEELISQVVNEILVSYIDDNGRRCSKDAYQCQGTMLEAIAKGVIKDATREALKQWMDEKRPVLQEEIRKVMTRKHKSMAKLFVDGLADAIDSKYSIKFAVNFNGD